MLELPPGEPISGETLIADGWVYRDWSRMLPEFWSELLAVIGPDNYKLLTQSTYRPPDGPVTMRGQMMISPDGVANLKAYAEKRRH